MNPSATATTLLDAYAAIYGTASFRVNLDGFGFRVILSNEDCCTMGCDRCIAVMSKKPRFVATNETLDGAVQDLYTKPMEFADR